MQIEEIPLDKIRLDPNQPRKTIDGIRELAQSIKSFGLLAPIEVDEENNLIVGERRLMAFKALRETSGRKEYDKIPVIRQEIMGSVTITERQLVENIQRKDIPALELGLALNELKEKSGLTNSQIAKEVYGDAKKKTKVQALTSILKLPDAAKVALAEGKITLFAAVELLRLRKQPEDQNTILEEIIDEKSNREVTKCKVERALRPKAKFNILAIVAENDADWFKGEKVSISHFGSEKKVTGKIKSCNIQK